MVAEGHGGHISRAELLELGLSARAIRHRVERGLLIPVFKGVYAVGHLPTNPLDRAAGALLACGPRAALSHRSAGSLWGVFADWRYPADISTGLDRRPAGIIVHHRPALLRADISDHVGLPVTSTALTLLDIAPGLSRRRLVRAFNELRMDHGLRTEDVESLLIRFPRHPGANLLRPIVGSAPNEPNRSPFEDDWPPFAERYGLTGWDMNVHVSGHRVDVLFLPELLIVELDGWKTHGTKPSFESDRDQDAGILARTGIPTVRITHRQFHRAPAKQARRICSILDARRAAAA